MDPNSLHQWWSKWTWIVKPGRKIERSWNEVQANCARFGKKAFGLAAQMRIRQLRGFYIVEVLAEGNPVTDESWVDYMQCAWNVFFENGFGLGTTSKLNVKLMAGSKQDGTPSEQLVMMPFVALLNPIEIAQLKRKTG